MSKCEVVITPVLGIQTPSLNMGRKTMNERMFLRDRSFVRVSGYSLKHHAVSMLFGILLSKLGAARRPA
jgi:hypothetical protein